jgi:PTH1 family peptidyl-tRNA hydrolase
LVLVLGLGNPGPEYELTRHNAGFLAVDTLAEKHRVPMDRHEYHSILGKGRVAGCEAVLAKPLTFMNESGRAARRLLQVLDLPPERMIVVYDEMDFPLGKVKRKFGGGGAGHNGIGSILDRLGTDQFHRVRIGVGRPDRRKNNVDYLLTRFTDDELTELNPILEDAVNRIEETLIAIKTHT